MSAVSTSMTAVPLAGSATGLASTRAHFSAGLRLPCRPVRRVVPGQQRPQRVAAAAAAGQPGGEWSQTSKAVEYSVPETSATGQVSNEQYASFHGSNQQYSAMQPASLTSTMGFRGLNLPNVMRGPSSVVLLIAMVAFTIFTAVRKLLQRKTRNCQTCKSYGIVRCNLCAGQGSINWEGKWSHSTLCPGCFGKRHTKCESCGGMHNRSRFDHIPAELKDPFPVAAAAAAAVTVPPIPAANRSRD